MAKWGWALRFPDSSEAAEQADSDCYLGCGMMNVYKPDEHPERPEDLEDAEIDVFQV
ncbi:hypothetical protein SAMN02910370_01684 [Lachnospiraceae bacterium XPB1003]|nr:hypothetical protein SAMN02910370_01684 [Lachnospiraceae bacterium XPB1003]